jgi:hypothetical protein
MGQHCAMDFMGQRIALNDNEPAAACCVVPEFSVDPTRIGAFEDCPIPGGLIGIQRRVFNGRITGIGKFAGVTFAADGTGNAHVLISL